MKVWVKIVKNGKSKVVEIGRSEYVQLKRQFGLGDAVALVAQPIARAIDAVAGTKIAECGGCKKRREALNKIHL